jgi:hypothetical protein
MVVSSLLSGHRGSSVVVGALCAFVASAASASVSISGPGAPVDPFSQVSAAMAWIDANGGGGEYSVTAGPIAGRYSAFEMADNTTLNWGFSPGLLEIEGTLRVRSTSSLTVELGGTDNSDATGNGNVEYDTILCTDWVNFEGKLKLVLVNGFVPTVGDTFEVIASGTYIALAPTATVEGPAVGPGLSWQLSVGPSSFVGTHFAGESLFVTLVPAPGAVALLGLVGLVGRRRR